MIRPIKPIRPDLMLIKKKKRICHIMDFTMPADHRVKEKEVWFGFVWFGFVWFGLVLWDINHCRLFNAKSIFIHKNSSISNDSV